MYSPAPPSTVSTLAAAALPASASSLAHWAIWAFNLDSNPGSDCCEDLDMRPFLWPNTWLWMKSSQLRVLSANNYLLVPPIEGCLCPFRVQLEDFEQDIYKFLVVEDVILAAHLSCELIANLAYSKAMLWLSHGKTVNLHGLWYKWSWVWWFWWFHILYQACLSWWWCCQGMFKGTWRADVHCMEALMRLFRYIALESDFYLCEQGTIHTGGPQRPYWDHTVLVQVFI